MSCKVKHKNAFLNSRDFLITQGAIDKVSNIKSQDIFNEANTQLSEDALNAYGVEGTLWNEKDGRAVPNHSVLKSIDEKRKELGLYDTGTAGTVMTAPEEFQVEDVPLDSEGVSYFEYDRDYDIADFLIKADSIKQVNNYEIATKVDYSFKVVDAITNNLGKINQWSKQLKGDALYDKIQRDLQIPKDQMVLFKESEGESVDDKLASFLANYSYTVEVNTVKGRSDLQLDEYGEWQSTGRILPESNTQYYSNLTVPGGTNYTENEILTPAITPSIKGHAQFASDKGIGWFRSDEQATGRQIVSEEIYYNEDNEPVNYITRSNGSKTRRILELQSDLFQKGRDKEDLAELKVNQIVHYQGKSYTIIAFQDNDNVALEGVDDMFDNQVVKSYQIISQNKNQFLQLLNKDNNWVTFFIKSIIQDSAKKGYEKVLFPTGNTASKVEGHTTLEEFKKQKEDRIKELEQNPSWITNGEYINEMSAFKVHGEIFDQGSKLIVKDGFYNIVDYDKSKILNREQALNFFKEADITPTFVSDKNEINQLKQELERVETEGFGALKPIYNFYENVVSNILKKQFGKDKVKSIKDEYGNTWNELTLKDIATPTIDGRPLTVENFDNYLPQFSYATEFEKQLIIDSIFNGDISINCKI